MILDPGRPSFAVDGRDWPNRSFSRFITVGEAAWHVQEMGAGPKLLLLHGTGASTHSFRDLAPALAKDFRLLVPDLPGHGFSEPEPGRAPSLPGMARSLAGLLEKADFSPEIVVGHSAGAAILVAMALEHLVQPRLIIALNGALRPIRGAALFSPLARLLSLNPLVPRLFARRAMSRDAVRRLLEGTGSQIEPRGIDLYARLFQRHGHVSATLGMMAAWDLGWLDRRLGRLETPLVLVTAAGDRAVPPADAVAVASRVPSARVVPLGAGGHLVHEEKPAAIADLIRRLVAETAPAMPATRETGRRGAAS